MGTVIEFKPKAEKPVNFLDVAHIKMSALDFVNLAEALGFVLVDKMELERLERKANYHH